MNKVISFLGLILFQGWNSSGFLVSVLLALIPFLVPNELSLKARLVTVGIVAVFLLLIKIAKQFYVYYCGFNRPIKVLKQIDGEGANNGQKLIVFEKVSYIPADSLITLFSEGSSINQAIAIIKIVHITEDAILGVQYIPDSTVAPRVLDIYFEEEQRKKFLSAIPLINESELKMLANIVSKK